MPENKVIVTFSHDEQLLALLSRMLEREAFEIHSATSCAACLSLVNSCAHIDLFLVDVFTIQLCPDDVAKALKSTHPNAGLLLLSDWSGQFGNDQPGTAVLAKPFTRGDLLAFVSAVLARRKPPRLEVHSLAEERANLH